MRIPSIRAAAAGARRVSERFPFVLLAAVVAAAVGSAMAGGMRQSLRLEAALAAATLGIPLFTALALGAERARSRSFSIALGLLGAAALAVLAIVWPHWPEPMRVRRYAQLSIAFHLLVAFLPFLDGREPNGFWQHNRTLFLRFFSAFIHSAVLFAGLAIALLAINMLFGVKVRDVAYARLWLFVAFVFNTWFFLGGAPADLPELDRRRDYPRALRVFSQFILIPIVVVYLAILTTYFVRVLVTGQWPSNWIGYLVSCVATVGILSLLLVHPLRDEEGHGWVGRYARWFYVALLPAVGMLLAAVGKRIGQYGITEDRYFAAVLASWLAVISLTFLLRHRTDVRWIPVTLCALAIVTLAGPFGAYAVSRRSQTARLRATLGANGLLAGGVAVPASGTVPFEARKQASGIVGYLLRAHGPGPVRAVLGDAMPRLHADTASAARHDQRDEDAKRVMKALGMTYVYSWEGRSPQPFSFYGGRAGARAVRVRGADYHVPLEGAVPAAFAIEGESWQLEPLGGRLALVMPRDTLWFPMDTLITFALEHGAGPDSAAAPRLTRSASGVTATLAPRSYSGSGQGDSAVVHQITGDLYVTLR